MEFGRRLGLEPKWACRYLYLHGGLELLDKNYQAEHLLPIDDTIDDAQTGIQPLTTNVQQSTTVYDITGRPLQGKPSKPGIYIHNGRKIVQLF